MHGLLFVNLNILDEKIIFIHDRNRICYLIPCDQCGEATYHPKYAITKSLKNRSGKFFCSQKCAKLHKKKSQIVECKECGIQFEKCLSQIISSPNHFCSHKCATTYQNRNKTTGIRRSKLEKFIEENIKNYFSDFEFIYNNTKIIGTELDIYCPTLKLAIQINGPVHYEPIYGEEKFQRVIDIDNEKRMKCKDMNINLFEINVSEDNVFDKTKDKRWLEVKSIIDTLSSESN